MPDRPTAPPLRLYTIPPSAPFLSTLARAVLDGNLPFSGAAKPSPLTLPQATIYLPTRRAVRGLRDAFLEASGGRAALLPSIRALGDPDEDAAIIFGEGEETLGAGGMDIAGAAAIAPLARRLALMRLVLAWGETFNRAEAADPTILGRGPRMITPSQASYLAADLGRLMDLVESEEADLSSLARLVPEEHAEHWARTIDFLEIVTAKWPDHLNENVLVSPVVRRNTLMAAEGERLLNRAAEGPVIAAGSTGTVPATARLLKIIASIPNGAVVLPGLDLTMDQVGWDSLRDHPEHPQAGMAELLLKLGATRDDVSYLPGSRPEDAATARAAFISEVLRPAGETDRWRAFIEGQKRDTQASLWGPRNALAGVELIEAPTAHDEAEAIALILRQAIETKDKTAALVTPDRTLARRVAARLRSYDLAIDDSAGEPVARTVPGAFLDLVLSAAAADFASPDLMALLKHPYARLGRSVVEAQFAASAVERGAFRDIYVGQGLDGVAAALDAARDSAPRSRQLVLTDAERRAARRLVADLRSAFAPLAALFAGRAGHAPSSLASAHAGTAEALARDETGSPSRLWAGDAGEAFSVLFAELIADGHEPRMAAGDYPAFYRSLLAGRVARPRRPTHPRLSIWGPLEARLQQPDLVILGGLNEGTWPRPQDASPWLSRAMAADLNLPPPERRIGLAAHDFAQALGARQVYLTRALKVEGVPTVPSRWLQRLTALAAAAGLKPALQPASPWVEWAKKRDEVSDLKPASPPAPKPPVGARPNRLSVTRIERWIANPYEIFARDILRLYKMKPLGAELDAAARGTIIHEILSTFAARHPSSLPPDIEAELADIAKTHFATLGGSARVEAFWRPSFLRFARWFAATEPGRRAGVTRIATEVKGSIGIGPDKSFTLTARADRIDTTAAGVVIYDYKTGKPPNPSQVEKLFSPQLPLEAAIAESGGFEGLDAGTVDDLRYIHTSGRGDGGDVSDAGKSSPSGLAARAVDSLAALVAYFAQPEAAYEVKRRPGTAFDNIYKYDDYEQLARIKEWLTQELDEEWS